MAVFSPTDMTCLANMGGFPAVAEVSKKYFQTEIQVILNHLKLFNQHPVIRDHSHSDYLTEYLLEGPGTTRKLLAADYEAFVQEAANSSHYREACRSLNYTESLDAHP